MKDTESLMKIKEKVTDYFFLSIKVKVTYIHRSKCGQRIWKNGIRQRQLCSGTRLKAGSVENGMDVSEIGKYNRVYGWVAQLA